MRNDLIYICSPYSGNTEANTLRAREYCRAAMEEGFLPVAPHLYFPQFLDDTLPEERETGLRICERLLCRCREVWVFGGRISAGMKREMACAEANGIPVRYFNDVSSVHPRLDGCRAI